MLGSKLTTRAKKRYTEFTHFEVDSDVNVELAIEARDALRARLKSVLRPLVMAAGALPDPSSISSMSSFFGYSYSRATFAQVVNDGLEFTPKCAITQYSVLIDYVENIFTIVQYGDDETHPFWKDALPTSDKVDFLEQNDLSTLRMYAAIFVPVTIRYEAGAHACFMVLYPETKLATFFDPADNLLFTRKDYDAVYQPVKNCQYLEIAKEAVECAHFRNAFFVDQLTNAEGSVYNDNLQDEMEKEVKGQLENAMLSSTGFCVTWSMLAMYACIRTGVMNPRIVMGVLQAMMRENPPFMVAVVAGSVIRGVHYVQRNNERLFNNMKAWVKDNEEHFTGTSWYLTPKGMKELEIDEKQAKEEYKDLISKL